MLYTIVDSPLKNETVNHWGKRETSRSELSSERYLTEPSSYLRYIDSQIAIIYIAKSHINVITTHNQESRKMYTPDARADSFIYSDRLRNFSPIVISYSAISLVIHRPVNVRAHGLRTYALRSTAETTRRSRS
jgi:hypothetical protein